MKLLVLTAVLCAAALSASAQKSFENKNFGYSATVPEDWRVYAEIRDDGAGRSLIDWGLPNVYSTAEKQSIENAVSITSYRRDSIRNIDDLQRMEFERISPIEVSQEKLGGSATPMFELITKINRVTYKGRTAFYFQNGVGYVAIYTATPGTYAMNLPKFEAFLKTLRFTKPAAPVSTKASATIRTDALYVAKTGTLKIGGADTDIYTYLRFTDDGAVYTQTVSSYNPAGVAAWFGPNGRFERKGRYHVTGASLDFSASNAESPDGAIEGPKTDRVSGTISDNGKLYLRIVYAGGKDASYWFEAATPQSGNR